jgi:Ran GTPase-activating protein (RanGAP) involved in mRNA processing and transport
LNICSLDLAKNNLGNPGL